MPLLSTSAYPQTPSNPPCVPHPPPESRSPTTHTLNTSPHLISLHLVLHFFHLPDFPSISQHIIHAYSLTTGHQRRPPRPPTKQESLGIRRQRRPPPPARTHLPKTQRRGRRGREALLLRASGQCRKSKGVDYGRCGGCLGAGAVLCDAASSTEGSFFYDL